MSALIKQLEERLAQLEKEVQELKSKLTKEPETPWWERTAGMFEGDEVFEQIVREIRKIRRADRKAAGCTSPDPFGTKPRRKKDQATAKGSR